MNCSQWFISSSYLSDCLCLLQDSVYPSMNTSFHKFAYSEPGSFYCDYGHGYVMNDHTQTSEIGEYGRNLEDPSSMIQEQTGADHMQREENSISPSHANPVECKF